MTTTITDTRPTMPALPEVGNIVEVRGATWAVTNVSEQGLSRSPADESRSGKQHVVSLQSLEEDRLGEELSVIWELEIGQTVIPSRGLPDVISADSFDDPNRLGAFVDAMRWGSVTSADDKKFEAPFRTGANLEPYQLEPLRRAISAPRTNLLLADDVGLGKTIEAGMVIQELLLRHRARTVIIVCPPSLCLKWQEEMREKFGLDFVIVNSEALADARRQYGLGSNPFRLFPRVIVSMAWVPSIRAQRLFEEVYADAGRTNSARRYSFDLLIVDEAHHVAPSAPTTTGKARGYAVDSKRTETVRRLDDAAQRLDKGAGVIILTDMFGGTPTNLALSLLGSHNVEVVTGVNLPMLLKVFTCREKPLAELAKLAGEAGTKGIVVAGSMLRSRNKEKTGD